ncbi:hypothetical protein C8R45DRAFT_1087643 [Mycena sanguinolenta]|nr:hypothetical protein C8R45DRAFT_1087643 [Mycena sanguinolenta]
MTRSTSAGIYIPLPLKLLCATSAHPCTRADICTASPLALRIPARKSKLRAAALRDNPCPVPVVEASSSAHSRRRVRLFMPASGNARQGYRGWHGGSSDRGEDGRSTSGWVFETTKRNEIEHGRRAAQGPRHLGVIDFTSAFTTSATTVASSSPSPPPPQPQVRSTGARLDIPGAGFASVLIDCFCGIRLRVASASSGSALVVLPLFPPHPPAFPLFHTPLSTPHARDWHSSSRLAFAYSREVSAGESALLEEGLRTSRGRVYRDKDERNEVGMRWRLMWAWAERMLEREGR